MELTSKRSFSLIIFFLIPFLSLAQTDEVSLYAFPAIKVDTITRKTSAPLPFDRNFTLQYDLRKDEVVKNVFIYFVKIIKGERSILLNGSGIAKPQPILDTFYMSGNTLNIQIKYLPPNTLIDILIVKKVGAQELATLNKINEMLYRVYSMNPPNKSVAMAAYNQFLSGLSSTIYPDFNRFVTKADFAKYDSLFSTDLWPSYDTLHTYNYFHSLPAPFAATGYHQVDSIFRALKFDNTQLTRAFRMSCQYALDSNVVSGKIRADILKPSNNKMDTSDFQQRIENLTINQGIYDTLFYQLTQAQLAGNNSVLSQLMTNIDSINVAIAKSRTVISNQVKRIAKNTQALPKLIKDDWVLSGNDFTDLTAKSRYLLVPDLGITSMFLGGRDRVHFVPRPFLGTNIYFRPVDKTLREKSLPDRDWRRLLSLQIGLTYGNFESTEFSNLFSDFSILVGPSLKLNRTFRLTSGTVLYKTTDKNPLKSATKVAASFYFAFSFDIDILSNANSIARGRIFK